MSSTPEWDWQRLRRLSEHEARRVLRTRDDVDDAVQEALARAWRQREACRTPHLPDAWVAQIARREALRLAVNTRSRGERQVPLPQRDDDEWYGTPAPEDRVEDIDVRRALRPLTDLDRTLLTLRYVDDLTVPSHGPGESRAGVASALT